MHFTKLKWIKYFVLAFLVICVWLIALPIASSISPWNAFGSLVSGNYDLAVSAITTIGFVLLLVIIAGSFFIERFFCRYLCPLGAIFTPISKKRLFIIRKNAAAFAGTATAIAIAGLVTTGRILPTSINDIHKGHI